MKSRNIKLGIDVSAVSYVLNNAEAATATETATSSSTNINTPELRNRIKKAAAIKRRNES